MLAPVVLFVYNRPKHTNQTLEALSKNMLSAQSTLYIYADGPKKEASEEELKEIERVRNLIRKKKWCGTVHIIEREHNWGLADNIVDGVTAATNTYGKAIVLEDDIVTSPGFLQYMNDALNLYADTDSVMHISGYMFPVKDALPPTFFYSPTTCWGWGTWARAWKHFNPNAQELAGKLAAVDIHKFNANGTYPYYEQLVANATGQLKTWAVKWYASVFLLSGNSLHPYPSLVNNIGNDGGGENCGISHVFGWNKLAQHISVKPIPVAENNDAVKLMEVFNRSIQYVAPKYTLLQRIKDSINYRLGIKL